MERRRGWEVTKIRSTLLRRMTKKGHHFFEEKRASASVTR